MIREIHQYAGAAQFQRQLERADGGHVQLDQVLGEGEQLGDQVGAFTD